MVHDSRSREYAAYETTRPPTKSVDHHRAAPIWDQGVVGSCTANAALGCLMTEPLHRDGWNFTEASALDLYELETRLDNTQVPGIYPPDDTGSSGLYSAKAMRAKGLVTGWRTAFGLNSTLRAIVDQPVSLGIPWPSSFMDPGKSGRLQMPAAPKYAGGHQVEVCGIDCTRKLVKVAQSWGPRWGDHGYCYLSWDDLGYLLRAGGDTTIFLV